MNHIRLLAILFYLFSPTLALAAVGKAIFVIGNVQIKSVDGETSQLKRGDQINAGDTIVTSKKGQVQVKMSDGTLLAIRPKSEFNINEYEYKKEVATDKSIYKLIKGGFRSITGKMGKSKKSSYAVKTVVGTIGIRGTDFSARLCDNNCGDSDNGLYVGVMDGGVVLTNDSGTLDVSPGDFGFMSDTGIEPDYLLEMPGDLLFAKSNNENSETQNQLAISSTNSTTSDVSPINISPLIASPLSTTKGDNLITGQSPELTVVDNTIDNNQPETIVDPIDVIQPGIALPSVGVASYTTSSFVMNADSNDFILVDLDVSTTKLTVDFTTTNVTADINFNNIMALDNVSEAENWTTTANMTYDENGDFAGTLSGNGDGNFVSRTITGTTTGSLNDGSQSVTSAPATVKTTYNLTESNSAYTLDGTVDFTLTGVK